MRYKVILSYNGSSFRGWQVQPNDVSVQGCLQHALSVLLGEEIKVTGAGRTDTGVHAIGYCAHFDASRGLDASDFRCKLNAILPSSVTVHEIFTVGEDFHARFGAVSRSYVYFLHRNKDPFIEKTSWRCGYPLDLEAMRRASAMILGTHDFSCFEKTGGNNKTSVCTVTQAEWQTYSPDHVRLLGFPSREDDYLAFHITADRFLRNMVRAVTGTLVDIGRGRHEPEWILEVLASRDRCSAGESVPGHALFLTGVRY